MFEMLDKDQGAYEIDLLVINCDRTLVAAATTSSKCIMVCLQCPTLIPKPIPMTCTKVTLGPILMVILM